MTKIDGPREKILNDVEAYYTDKIKVYGPTPAGVDWNGLDSQILRFEQLLRIIPDLDAPFSLSDLGCGYGQLFGHMHKRVARFEYRGYDLSGMMIKKARELFGNNANACFTVSDRPTVPADYAIASGIFNVKLETDESTWKSFFFDTLAEMDRSSGRGFAFNCLTSFSDLDKMRHHLYYADPSEVFNFCKRHFSRNVALLHDYGLFEFTILVRK